MTEAPLLAEGAQSDQQQLTQRADRFGLDSEPTASPGTQAKPKTQQGQPKAGGGFTVGIDLLDEAEVERRKSRAARFQTEGQGLAYNHVPAESAEDAANEEQKRSRADRFGTQYRAPDRTGQAEADILEARAEAAPEDLRRTDTLYMYGVDLLSTSDCQAYLEEHGPVQIEWLNDSACNAVFRDAATAARALVSLGIPLPPEAAAPDGSSAPPSELDLRDVRNAPYLWHKGPDFVKDGVAIALLIRMATIQDTKQGQSRRTRYLWDLPVQQAQEKQQALKRKAQLPEGDETMSSRKQRGGARLRRQKRRQQDVNMADAEQEDEGSEEVDESEAPLGAAAAEVQDLRQLLKAQDAPGVGPAASSHMRSEASTDAMQS